MATEKNNSPWNLNGHSLSTYKSANVAFFVTFVTSHLILFQGGTKLERARDLFEQCLENCPHKFAKGIYICIYSKPCLKPTTLEHTILVILDRWKISNIRTTFVLVYYNGFYFIYYEKNV